MEGRKEGREKEESLCLSVHRAASFLLQRRAKPLQGLGILAAIRAGIDDPVGPFQLRIFSDSVIWQSSI